MIDSRGESPILEVAHVSRFEAAKEVAFLWEDYSEYGWGKLEAEEVQIAGPADDVFEISFRSIVFCRIKMYEPGVAWKERESKRREEQRNAEVNGLKWDAKANFLKGLACAVLFAVFGNSLFPMDGIRLLLSSEKSSAKLVETYEAESGEDERGNVGMVEVGIYQFTVGGIEFNARESTNELGEYEDVIYFPGNPKLNMIDRGFRGWLIWVFERVVFSVLLFVFLLLGSFYFLREAARSRRKFQEENV